MKRILIIDDDQNLLLMLVDILAMLGFQTLSALDGASGIRTAVIEVPDLILCDLTMPSMDGFETLSQIRQSHTTAKIPFVLFSGYTDDGIYQQAIKSGANDVIAKPLSISDLLKILDLHLKAGDPHLSVAA